MKRDIEAESLTTFEIAPDGTGVRVRVRAVDGEEASVTLPSVCLNQLLMTLPRMALMALRARHGDDSLRIVYPIGEWSLERAAQQQVVVATFRTPDGFEVSFGLSREQCAALGDTLAELHPNDDVWRGRTH